jgi:hypothetical protein
MVLFMFNNITYIFLLLCLQRQGTARTLPNFCVVLCIVCFVLFCVLFVCICVLYYNYRVATHLQLTIIFIYPSIYLIFSSQVHQFLLSDVISLASNVSFTQKLLVVYVLSFFHCVQKSTY